MHQLEEHDRRQAGHVLIIDDEGPIRVVVSTVLEEQGYSVSTAADGDALRIADAQPPDLILLDIMMSVIEGTEIRRRLLENPRTATIPVVVMTSAGDALGWARRLGAVGALQKPFDINQLISLVEKVIGRPS